MQKISNTIDAFFALDELANRRSGVHAQHPMAKLVVTLVFIVCVISTGRYDAAGLTVYFFYPALLIALGELPFGAVLKRTLPALPFVLFAGLSNIFFERQIAPVGIPYGVLSCAVLLEKALLTVSAVVILAATTPANELLDQMQRLRLPHIFTTTLMLCFRYLTLLASEARNMTRAYHLRAVKQSGIEMKHIGAFVGQLLLRSIDRAERVYGAMQCRGFDGTFPSSQKSKAMRSSWFFASVVSLLLISLRAFGVSTLLVSLGKLFV